MTDRPLILRGSRELLTRVRFADDGRLLALVADGEDTNPLAFLSVPDGSPAPTRDQINEALAELDDDALAAIVEAAVREGEEIRDSDDPITPEVLARIELLADAREAAEERRTAIAEEERRTQEAADAGLSRLLPPPATDPDGDNDSGEDDSGDGHHGTPEGIAASAGTPPAPAAPQNAAQPPRRRRSVSALPRPGQVPSTPAPGGDSPGAYAPLRATSTLIAAAGLESIGLNTGQEIETRAQLGTAFDRKRQALRGVSGGDGEKITVATIASTYPEERQLGGSLDTNTARIDAVSHPEALVAAASYAREHGALTAAGLCGPVEQLYDVPVIGTAARPVQAALANFGADRGGVKWRQHISFGDFAGATGFWSLEDDEAVGTGTPPAPKPCLDVECPDDAEAYVGAVTFCMTFSNVTSRFDPESTAANVEAGRIAHARIAENRLMTQIAALCTTLTQGGELSFLRDYLTTLDRLFAAYRNFYRLEDTAPLHGVGPRWMRDAIRSDVTRGAGMSGDLDALAAAEAQITGWLASRGVNWTWHLDGRPAVVAAAGTPAMADQFYAAFTPGGAVPDYPGTVETLIWTEGDMLHLDGGTLDLGVVRDSTLNQVNRYKQFSETFEGVAHRGVEAVRLVSTVNPNGMTAGTADTAAILAA